jgi:thiol:disulfide interchange protein DsbC
MHKSFPVALASILVAASAIGPVQADEAQVLKALRSRLPPNMVIESITKAPVAGLYEVILDGEIVYTDEKAEHFFSGSLYDIRTTPPRNLTQERAFRVAADVFFKARDLAIRRVRGSGVRTLFTFEDPNCGYCKALAAELAKVNDVTIYTFLTPLLSEDSVEKSIAVWCAKDRARAWEELMTSGTMPESAGPCPHPLNQIAAITRRFQIQATPAIFLGDGRHIGGMRSAADIEKALASVAR